MDNIVQKNAPETKEHDLTGKTLGDYRVLRRLGKGGMGQVYLAEQISLRRKVALKLLRKAMAENPTYLQRFKIEAQAAASINHANIVQVYSIGEADGMHYMVMEYVEGRNLLDYLQKKGPPELHIALTIIRQVASALQRAGEVGIIHRDIKPENILLTRKGEVKVADFGLARIVSDQPLKLTQTGVTMGTPLYMSPEQVQCLPLDSRTDMYSLGATSYHMLAGEPPFRGDSAFQVSLKHVQEDPIPLQQLRSDLPVELCAVVHKMMAKKPEDRYQSPRELLVEIARLREMLPSAGSESIPLPALQLSSPSTPSAPSIQRSGSSKSTTGVRPGARRSPIRLAVSFCAITLAAFLGVGMGYWIFYHRVRDGGSTSVKSESEVANVAGEEENAQRSSVDAKLEAHYREGVERFDKPTNIEELKLGIGYCADLAVFYLKRGRLKEANQFFDSLIEQRSSRPARPEPGGRLETDPAFYNLGRLGRAMVLAFNDKTEDADRLFRTLLMGEPNAPRLPELMETMTRENPRLGEVLAAALERHRRNLGVQELPVGMERFRKPRGSK